MKRILIVDDSSTMRRMLRFGLTQGGLDVVEAKHGEDALDKLRSNTVDVIVTDLNMPVMDGITLIRKVRADPKMKHIPILMLTTDSLEEKKDQGRAAGATGWIAKPFDSPKLLAAISKLTA